jgi:outer membrane protein TolC
MKRPLRFISSFAVVALLAGCHPNQKKEVALYRDVLDGQVPCVGDYVDGEPLSLQRSLALANQNNENLGLRGEEYVQALIQKNRVVADFLPTVSFQPNFTIEQRATGNAATSTGPGGTGIGNGGNAGGGTGTNTNTATIGGGGFRNHGNVSTRFEAPVVGNINLYRGGGDVANLKVAEANIAQRRELLLDIQATVLLNVAQVYYQVLRSEASVDVLRNSLKLQEARLADVTQQFNNGLAIKLSVAQSRAQVDATRVALIQAESDVRNGRSTLALLVGVPHVDGPLTDGFAAPAQTAPEPDFEADAVATRQDLIAARHAIVAARSAVDVSFAQYYPSVSLNVSGFLYREFFSDASKWNAILAANLPIFSAGIIEADVRAAWSRLRQAALSESLTRRTVLNDVQQAYDNLATADRQIKELEDQVLASEDALVQSQNAYANSLAINLDVLLAQNDLLNAQLQLTSARFDRTIFYLNLVRATGRLHEIATSPVVPTTQPASQPTTQSATQPAAATNATTEPMNPPSTEPTTQP